MAETAVAPDTISMEQLAARLGISKAKAYEMAQLNEYPFPIIRIAGRVMASRRAYEQWLSQFDYQGEASETDDNENV